MAIASPAPAAADMPKRKNPVWQLIKSQPLGAAGVFVILGYVVVAFVAKWI